MASLIPESWGAGSASKPSRNARSPHGLSSQPSYIDPGPMRQREERRALPWPRILTADEKQTISPHQGRMEQVVASSFALARSGVGLVREGPRAWSRGPSATPTPARHSMVLLRNSYYFGDAYWSIYSSNPGFRTSFLGGRQGRMPCSRLRGLFKGGGARARPVRRFPAGHRLLRDQPSHRDRPGRCSSGASTRWAHPPT